MSKVYCVHKGKNPGTYFDYNEFMEQVTGFSNNVFKTFKTKPDAIRYLIDAEWNECLSPFSDSEINEALNEKQWLYIIKHEKYKGITFFSYDAARETAFSESIPFWLITRRNRYGTGKKIYISWEKKNAGIYYTLEDFRKQKIKTKAKSFKREKDVIGFVHDINRFDLLNDFNKNEIDDMLYGFNEFYVIPGEKIFYTKAGANVIASQKGISKNNIKRMTSLKKAQRYIKEHQSIKLQETSQKTIDVKVSFHPFEPPIDIQDNKRAVAYVDGSSYSSEYYTSGIVFICDGKTEYYNSKGSHPAMLPLRNIAGEIMAAWIAIDIALKRNIKKLRIYYDCTSIAYCCNERKNHKLKKEGMKMFAEFYTQASKYINIEFVKVKAHSGNKMHNKADQIAGNVI